MLFGEDSTEGRCRIKARIDSHFLQRNLRIFSHKTFGMLNAKRIDIVCKRGEANLIEILRQIAAIGAHQSCKFSLRDSSVKV